jgi:hypothetical protein
MPTVMVVGVTVGVLVVLTPFHWTVAPVAKLLPVLLMVSVKPEPVWAEPGLIVKIAGVGLLTVTVAAAWGSGRPNPCNFAVTVANDTAPAPDTVKVPLAFPAPVVGIVDEGSDASEGALDERLICLGMNWGARFVNPSSRVTVIVVEAPRSIEVEVGLTTTTGVMILRVREAV